MPGRELNITPDPVLRKQFVMETGDAVWSFGCTLTYFPHFEEGDQIEALECHDEVDLEKVSRRLFQALRMAHTGRHFCVVVRNYDGTEGALRIDNIGLWYPLSEQRLVEPPYKVGDLVTGVDRRYKRSIYRYTGPDPMIRGVGRLDFVSFDGFKAETGERLPFRFRRAKLHEFRLATPEEVSASEVREPCLDQ